jgi:hypothetical protein
MSNPNLRFSVSIHDEQPDMSGKKRWVRVAGPYLTAMQAEEARQHYLPKHPEARITTEGKP